MFPARLGAPGTKLAQVEVKDSNGQILQEGDSVTLIKDLKVKGSLITLKRGKVIKNIRFTDDPEEISCQLDDASIVLKAYFLKRINP